MRSERPDILERPIPPEEEIGSEQRPESITCTRGGVRKENTRPPIEGERGERFVPMPKERASIPRPSRQVSERPFAKQASKAIRVIVLRWFKEMKFLLTFYPDHIFCKRLYRNIYSEVRGLSILLYIFDIFSPINLLEK